MSFVKNSETVKMSFHHKELCEQYLKTVLRKSAKGEFRTTQWLLMQNLSLARRLVRLLIQKCENVQADNVIVLANSGIPLGVFMGLALDKPIYFYRREPWTVDDQTDIYIVPPLPKNSVSILVDSNINSGLTMKTCTELVKKQGGEVSSVVALFDIRKPHDASSDSYTSNIITPITLFERSVCVETLERITSSQKASSESISDILRPPEKSDHMFWTFDESGYIPSRSKRFWGLMRGMLPGYTGRSAVRKITYIDATLSRKLKAAFSSTDTDIWRFFTMPKLRKEVCETVNHVFDLGDIDVLIGTSYLGTAFALCLAWNSRFQGKIISTVDTESWRELQISQESNNHLICSGRLMTGIHTWGAIGLADRHNLNVSQVLALRFANELVRYPRNRHVDNIFHRIDDIYVLS